MVPHKTERAKAALQRLKVRRAPDTSSIATRRL
jgi:hypothetical protein